MQKEWETWINDLQSTMYGFPSIPQAQLEREEIAMALRRRAGNPAGPALIWIEPESGEMRSKGLDGAMDVGRSSSAGLRIRNPRLSRVHFRIENQESAWRIVDAESHNGTFVNGARLAAPHTLRDADIVEAGGLLLIFVAH